ncbi:MAG: hypothetical protein EB084_09240 [Proteobacteria bacterium]|nr:hypothetical protein [Pseudomonadota bacterium]
MRRREFLSVASASLGLVVLTQAGCGGGSASGLSATGSPLLGTDAAVAGGAPIVTSRVDAFTFNGTGTLFGIDESANTLFAKEAHGDRRWTTGGQGTQLGRFNGPSDLVYAPNGYIYVVDAGNARVQILDADGVAVGQFGTYGTGDGQFLSPNCIDVGSNDCLYVSDAAAHRVQAFSLNGEFKFSFGGFGLTGSNLNGPMGVAVIEQEVYVVDTGNGRVQVYTLRGAYLRGIGGVEVLSYPYDVEVATDGTVYVSDPATAQVILFNAGTGSIERIAITHDGSPASPQGISLDAEQRLFVAV